MAINPISPGSTKHPLILYPFVKVRRECERDKLFKIGDLSRRPESSEQFVWLNHRYGETETQLSRSAIMPSIRADASQNEVI